MTEQEINQKALEAYPEDICGYSTEIKVGAKPEPLDCNLRKREGYVKALKEVEGLPKIKGWVARDKNGEIHYFQEYPRRVTEYELNHWWDRDYISMWIEKDSFPELTWEDEPVEVELLIRRV